MAAEEVKIKFAGEDDGLAAEARKEVAAINAVTAARELSARNERRLLDLKRALQNAEAESRKAAFDRLPLEQQINQLLERRAALQARLNNLPADASLKTRLAYSAALKLNDISLSGKQAEQQQNINDQSTARQQREEQKLAANRKLLALYNEKDKDEAFAKLKPAEQLLELETRRERLLRLIARTGDNELRRTNLQLALRRTTDTLTTVRNNQSQAPTIFSGIRDFLHQQTTQLFSGATLALMGNWVRMKSGQIIQDASQTKDLADRLGTNTSNAQAFKFAGARTNLSTEDLGNTLKSIGLAQEKAQRGDKDSLSTFSRFGISLQQLREARPDEIFKQIALNAKEGKTAAATLTDATNVFGRGADRVLVALRTGFADAMEEIKRSGGIIDEATINQLDDAAKNFQLLGNVLTAFFAPALAYVLDILARNSPTLLRWANNLPTSMAGRFAGALAGGASFGEALRSGILGGNEMGDELEKKLHRAELQKQARANAIAFKEEQLKKLNDAVAATDDPKRRKELQTEARKTANDIEVLKTGRDPEKEREARILELRKEVTKAEKDAAFERLTKEEKIAYLKEKKAAEADKLTANSDEEDRLRVKLKQAEYDKQIADLQKDDGIAKITSPDALSRIGGRLGAQNPVVDETKRLRIIAEKKLDRVNSQLEALNGKWKDFA